MCRRLTTLPAIGDFSPIEAVHLASACFSLQILIAPCGVSRFLPEKSEKSKTRSHSARALIRMGKYLHVTSQNLLPEYIVQFLPFTRNITLFCSGVVRNVRYKGM